MKYLLAVALAFLTSCVTTVIATPSGRPEVVVPTADHSRIVGAAAADLAPRGWNLVTSNEFSATFENPGDLGTQIAYGASSRGRIMLTLAPEGERTRIFAAIAVQSEDIGMNQRTLSLDQQNGADLQRMLERIRESLGGAPAAVSAVMPTPTPTQTQAAREYLAANPSLPRTIAAVRSGTTAKEADGALSVSGPTFPSGLQSGERIGTFCIVGTVRDGVRAHCFLWDLDTPALTGFVRMVDYAGFEYPFEWERRDEVSATRTHGLLRFTLPEGYLEKHSGANVPVSATCDQGTIPFMLPAFYIDGYLAAVDAECAKSRKQ